MDKTDKKNGDKYTEFDCPYRGNCLSDYESCSSTPSSSDCEKGFDPGQLERGDLISDIRCWLEEELEDD